MHAGYFLSPDSLVFAAEAVDDMKALKAHLYSTGGAFLVVLRTGEPSHRPYINADSPCRDAQLRVR